MSEYTIYLQKWLPSDPNTIDYGVFYSSWVRFIYFFKLSWFKSSSRYLAGFNANCHGIYKCSYNNSSNDQLLLYILSYFPRYIQYLCKLSKVFWTKPGWWYRTYNGRGNRNDEYVKKLDAPGGNVSIRYYGCTCIWNWKYTFSKYILLMYLYFFIICFGRKCFCYGMAVCFFTSAHCIKSNDSNRQSAGQRWDAKNNDPY